MDRQMISEEEVFELLAEEEEFRRNTLDVLEEEIYKENFCLD